MHKVTVITGHYGSGKSNISANLALEDAENGENVTVVDLDIVNPYFRTADLKDFFGEKGIELIAPSYANTNLDIPALNFDLGLIAAKDDVHLIVDVGGDDDGAVALGRFAQQLKDCGNLEMLYVVNRFRYMTREPYEAQELMYKIENASHLKHTGIINNSNLGEETTKEVVESSLEYAKELSQKVNLPVAFNTAPDYLGLNDERFKNVKVLIKPIWAKDI